MTTTLRPLRSGLKPVRSRYAVVCLPFAGGAAQAYAPLARHLGTEIEIWSAQLPGRHDRVDEAPFTTMEQTVAELTRSVQQAHAENLVLFGHSLGAVLAFEVARGLRRAGDNPPVALIVTGASAPQLRAGAVDGSIDPDSPLDLAKLGGIPERLRAHPRMLALFLSTMKADLEVAADYRYVHESPLDLGVTAFGGTEDPFVPEDTIGAWVDQGMRPGNSELLGGGHFFISDHWGRLAASAERALGVPRHH